MVVRLADGIWWIQLHGVNAYLVEDGDELVLCDAGMPWHRTALRAQIEETGHAVTDIDRILITHYDLDHVGGLAGLDIDAPIYAGGDDVAVLRGDAKPPLNNHKGLLQRGMGLFLDLPSNPIRSIADGERLGSFTAFHTPGHNPGHFAYISEELAVGLLGDLVRSSNGGLTASPWLFSYDTREVRTSIRSLVERAPAFEVTCPGHGPPLRENGSTALAALVE
jgi:glyoxylase-like metal-dependent hydrolase (beta-lactamase superfamily II)